MMAFESYNAAGVWGASLLGAVLALAMGALSARKKQISLRTCAVFSGLSVLFTLFFAHLFQCLMRLDYVLNEQSFLHLFTFWEGGFMLYGGLFGALLAAFAAGKLTGVCPLKVMDAYAPAGAVMIAFARLAEAFSGQGYGDYLWEEGFFTRFPFATFNPDWEAWAWSISMPEILWALIVLVILLSLRKNAKPGDKTLVLVGLYAAMQVVFESLRRDEFLRWGFVRCSELLSAVALFIVLLCYQLRSGRVWKKRHIVCWIGYVVLVVSCILLEFATEERIPFLTFLSPEACYVCMTGCCALLCGCVMVMRSTEPVKS